MRNAVGLPDQVGVLVRSVVPDSPADAAGLTRGDMITAAGGEQVRTIADLQQAVTAATEEGTLTLQIVRGVEDRTVEVQLAPSAEA